MTKSLIDELEIGMPVWDYRIGKGVIGSITTRNQNAYPIRVHFENGRFCDYDSDGRYSDADIVPSLFFEPPVIKGKTRPSFTRLFKRDQIIIANKISNLVHWEQFKVYNETEHEVISTTDIKYRKSDWVFHVVAASITA